ncbi:MAG: hypothetical protein MUC88_16100 [Planctomycetes bacterium]|jgi:hypothetical protein|nr:hypothetical protein [Planctomycetota bacterium]
MTAKERSQAAGSPETSADDAFSSEWFLRYLLDAAGLGVLVLTAIGIALYLDRGAYLQDWNKEPAAGFLVCLLLCPMLAVVTLALAVYAGIRVFLRPRTWGHAFIRLAFLVAHLSVLVVCAETVSSTAAALGNSFRQSSAQLDPTEAWRAVDGRDFSNSPAGDGQGAPPFAPPSGFGGPGLSLPGGGTGSR